MIEAQEFARHVRLFLETLRIGGSMDVAILKRLAALYTAAFALPDVDSAERDPGAERPNLPAPFDLGAGLYSTTLNPLDPTSGEVGCGDLDDDLRDIALDVGRGLACYDAGASASAVWYWRFTFESHWGRHASEAIRVLHQLACQRNFTD